MTAEKTCRLSVVIPTRDNIDVLPKALKSVQDQRFADLEIIVADDGSVDGTNAWLTKFRQDERRLRIIETGGKGPANARNQAISIARAPLIAFLDADDWWNPGKVRRQVSYLEQNKTVGFSFTDYLALDPEGRTYGTCFEYWKPAYGARPPQGYDLIADGETELLSCNAAGTSTVMARRDRLEAAGGFSTSLPSAEDWDLWLRLAAVAPVACTSIVTTCYLMRPGSESMRRLDRLAAMATIIDRYRTRPEPEMRVAVRLADSRVHAGRADIARGEGRYWSAVSGELMALVSAPTVRKAKTAASDVVKGVRSAFGGAEAVKRPDLLLPKKDNAAA